MHDDFSDVGKMKASSRCAQRQRAVSIIIKGFAVPVKYSAVANPDRHSISDHTLKRRNLFRGTCLAVDEHALTSFSSGLQSLEDDYKAYLEPHVQNSCRQVYQ